MVSDRGLPGSLHYAARRAKKQRGRRSRAAPVGMTEKAKPNLGEQAGVAAPRLGLVGPSFVRRGRRYPGRDSSLETLGKMGLCEGRSLL